MAITVTATASGTHSRNGLALTVKVLTGAAAVQNGTAVSNPAINPGELPITPAGTGSWIYGAVCNIVNSTSFTPAATTTFSQNLSDATNGDAYGTFRSTATTTAATPVTLGATAPAVSCHVALAEVLTSGTLAEDASSPAVVHTFAAKTIATASFTPPAGSLIVAVVASDYDGTGNPITMTVSDSSGLTWALASADSDNIATVWFAYVSPFIPSVSNSWSATLHRAPTQYVADAPPLLPLAIPVANTAGQWMFAIASWRQDAGTVGDLQYPSTVTISDDANNFWIPVGNGLSDAFGLSDAGIVRPVIWMAPAARVAQTVFVSPTNYQAALDILIIDVVAACPWYQVELVVSTYANQGTSTTLTAVAPAGAFMVGVLGADNATATYSNSTAGWNSLPFLTTTNGIDGSGDMDQVSLWAVSAGAPMTISSTASPAVDYGIVIIAVTGVATLNTFPYSMPLENWPVLVTEIGTGSMTSTNPMFAQGLTGWGPGSGTSVAAATWPQLSAQPDYGTDTPGTVVQVTPAGTFGNCSLLSSLYAVSPAVQYNALAYVYSPAGFGIGGPPLTGTGAYVGIVWYDVNLVQISETTTTQIAVPVGSWTQLMLGAPVFPPENAVWGLVAVTEWNGGANVPSTAVFYVGYAAFGPTGAYENLPPDEIAWTDVSALNFTQNSIQVSRGIQYEQQSLEAGTMTVTLANNGGAFTFGNVQSPYWPFAGDTDVPIRLRAIWPLSLTPYYVLFSGFTDQNTFGWDAGTRYGYAEIEAADAWSRLTAQMLTALQQEILEDNPNTFITCNLSGSNLAPGNTTAAVSTPSQFGAVTGTANFSSDAVNLLGGQGLSCWQSAGTGIAGALGEGIGLTYFPLGTNPLPPTAGGVTMEFWMAGTVAGNAGQPIQVLTLCTCWAGTGPMWSITLDNTGSTLGVASISVYDQSTGAVTHTPLTDGVVYLNATNTPINWFFTVSFTQSSLTVGSGISYTSQTTVSCNLAAQPIGFSFGGNAGPLFAFNYGGNTPGFMDVAIADFAVFEGILPPARLKTHWETASLAWPSELDVWRIARVTGYAGATPVALQMRGRDLPVPPGPDLDLVTAITDTNGQVTSSYYTNIASSTLAFMFVPGTGVMAYRRRLEVYDGLLPQWAVGEHAPLPINTNTLGQAPSFAGWTVANNAAISTSSQPQVSPLFEFCGVFHGDGSTSNPSIVTSPSLAVTAGKYYSFTAQAWSTQGWNTGCSWLINWLNVSLGTISSISSGTFPIPAGGNAGTFVAFYDQQAPAGAVFAQVFFLMDGVPPVGTLMYVTDVRVTDAAFAEAGGPAGVATEAPYMVDVQLSADRALLYNQAILTQYGTSTAVTYQGPSLVFTPTSGVLVTISNQQSINQRAAVPYTATSYLNNTVQEPPYELDDPSMEDFGNWITQTLATPLLRPETVTITPASTVQSTLMGLQAEVGDTVTFRRRALGAPEIEIVTYISKLSHDIDISTGKWDTKYELSPFPQGSVLACDNVIFGVLDGNDVFGW
jgi:hypothetical protein